MTTVEDHPPVSFEAFNEALAELLIVWPKDEEPYFAGCTSPAHELVARFVEDVLDANRPLIDYLHGRFVTVAPVIRWRRSTGIALRRSARRGSTEVRRWPFNTGSSPRTVVSTSGNSGTICS